MGVGQGGGAYRYYVFGTKCQVVIRPCEVKLAQYSVQRGWSYFRNLVTLLRSMILKY